MFKRMILILPAMLAMGCASHSHQPKTIHYLDSEHNDRKVVVVKVKPSASRRCWKHAGHWHCRRT